MPKSEEPKRRTAVVALDNFAHRKGVKKALDEFRERQEKKRVETAKALRSYQKVMKQEGYEPGRGASRKRGAEVTELETKKRRTHMFQKPVQQAEERKKGIEESQIAKEKSEKERKNRLRERRQRTKMLTQRTKHGQPVMKNMVHDILNKLERQKDRP
ncbi:hypothetical protein FisN_24Lh216 [Fistulifera solaris]|uniref:rRNA-processing protein FYV7 n=1 Tax=Fistulifera solaris TaxID=1519565 RepID=A0A1Z5K9J9_FISSO|nr:hypothetical protein FisN_24Lh216 [Fistulifera solaris]|eukprot:GAX22927.1 hypothetical protein FisN_24Lh216 [Fistulifera solaris]